MGQRWNVHLDYDTMQEAPMGIDTMQEAPLALAGYWIWLYPAGALLLFGFGWFLCAKIKSRKIGAIEEQTERRVSKLVEKADRERKAAFLLVLIVLVPSYFACESRRSAMALAISSTDLKVR